MFFCFILGAVLATVGGLGLNYDKKIWQFKKMSQLVRYGPFWRWSLIALAGCALLTAVIF